MSALASPTTSSPDRRRPSRRLPASFGCLLGLLLLDGCGRQSTLSPRSPQTHQISLLWWWMLGAATIVFLGAVGLLIIAWWKRDVPGFPIFGERETMAEGLVLLFGIAIPIVVLVTLFGVANVFVITRTQAPNPKTTAMSIEVIGHQWWWEVRYPGTAAVTANEIHIPLDTRVNLVSLSADVIHSFWVPQLARKVDMIPGRRNRILLYASRSGRYRGQCAEFCGFQHANMALYVIAEPQDAFRAWLAKQAAPAPAPPASAAAGEHDFMAGQCASCHQIRGTSAHGSVGPDLTHLAGRTSLAAAEIPNTPSELVDWITNPQGIKPGTRMPDLGLPPTQVSAIAAYLETLH